MNEKWLFPALLVAALGSATVASAAGGWLADDAFSASLAMTTDYVWRGVSQTDRTPALQGSFDYASPAGVYAGVWGSNVAFGGGLEMDWYGGYANAFGWGLSYDVGANYYSYPKSQDAIELDFVEFYGVLGYTLPLPLEPSLGVGYNYSPDFYGEDGVSHYVNGSLGLALPYGFGLSAEVGYLDVAGGKTTGFGRGLDGGDGFDYVHYRLGVAYDAKGFTLDLSWHDTTEEAFLESYSTYADAAGGKFVFTLSRSF